MSCFPLRIHQNRCQLGLCSKPHWGAYSAPRPPSWFQGRQEGNEGEGREELGGGEKRGKGEREEWGREGKRGKLG